jgi:cold shock CspA family protein
MTFTKENHMTGTITVESDKGFVFCEADETHQSIFIHISKVKDGRCLHRGDRVKFDITPNPSRPGQTMAVNVEYVGHTIARQVSGEKAVSHE